MLDAVAKVDAASALAALRDHVAPLFDDETSLTALYAAPKFAFEFLCVEQVFGLRTIDRSNDVRGLVAFFKAHASSSTYYIGLETQDRDTSVTKHESVGNNRPARARPPSSRRSRPEPPSSATRASARSRSSRTPQTCAPPPPRPLALAASSSRRSRSPRSSRPPRSRADAAFKHKTRAVFFLSGPQSAHASDRATDDRTTRETTQTHQLHSQSWRSLSSLPLSLHVTNPTQSGSQLLQPVSRAPRAPSERARARVANTPEPSRAMSTGSELLVLLQTESTWYGMGPQKGFLKFVHGWGA